MGVPVRVPTGAVAMAVVCEVIRARGLGIALAFPVTAVLPGRRAVAHPGLRSPHDREVPDDLPCLRAARRARRELQGVAHRHALLEALAALGTLVFVKSHAAMVERVAR